MATDAKGIKKMINLVNVLVALKGKAENLGIGKDVTIDGTIDTNTGDYAINFYFKCTGEGRHIQAVTARSISTANAFLLVYSAGKGK